MICTNCQYENNDPRNSFCGGCGTKFGEKGTTVSSNIIGYPAEGLPIGTNSTQVSSTEVSELENHKTALARAALLLDDLLALIDPDKKTRKTIGEFSILDYEEGVVFLESIGNIVDGWNKDECEHLPLIDTGVGYHHCPACDKSWTYDEWKHSNNGKSTHSPSTTVKEEGQLFIWTGIEGDLDEVADLKEAKKYILDYMEDGEIHPDIECIKLFRQIGYVKVEETGEMKGDDPICTVDFVFNQESGTKIKQ